MIRGLLMRVAFAMAGMLMIAVTLGVGAPDDTRPFEVRVIDEQGTGVPKIAVEVAAPGRPRRSFETDKDGRLTIPAGIAVEGAVLSASRGREAVAWAQVGDPARAYHDGTQGIAIVMKLLPLSRRVQGSVVDRQGKPIAGARLSVQSLFHPTNRLMDQDLSGKEPLIGMVESDPDGKFALALPPGTRARLRASHPRYAGPTIEVSEKAETVGPSTLEPAGAIVGQVTDATTGNPVARAAVAAQLIDRHAQVLNDGWGQSVTDDRGRFAVGGLEPGVYNLLLLEVPGRTRATATAVEGVRVRVGSEATASLSVVEGRPLRGVVIDRASGRPIADAQVGCQGTAVPRSGAGIMGTRTDEKGRFAFHVPPGEQFVYLIDDISASRMCRRVVVVPEQGDVVPLCLLQPPAGSFDSVPPPPPDGLAIDGAEIIVGGPGIIVERAVMAAAPAAVAAPEPAPAPARALAFVREFAVAVAAQPPAPAPRPPRRLRRRSSLPRRWSRAPVEMMTEIKTVQTTTTLKAEAAAVQHRTVTGRVRDAKGRPIAGIRVGRDISPSHPGISFDQFGSVATDREGTFVLTGMRRNPVSIVLGRPRYESQTAIIPADRDEVDLTYRFQPDANARNQSALIEDEPIPPELRPRLTFVDLAPYGNNYLTDGPAPAGDTNNLDRLPRGVHKLADSYFRIDEKLVQVKGEVSSNWPESVAGIKVGARGTKLHILHGTEQQAEPGTEIGNYLIKYADGSREKIPIVYGRNLVNWWHYPSQKNDPTAARIAWTGSNEMVDGRKAEKLEIRLFAFTWTNPHPDREIATIDVVSSRTICDPYLIAVTLERSVDH